MSFLKQNTFYSIYLRSFFFVLFFSFFSFGFIQKVSADDLIIGTANCTRPASSGGWGGECQIRAFPWSDGCTGSTPKYVGVCDSAGTSGCCVSATSTAHGSYEDKLLSEATCNGQGGSCKIRATPSSDGCNNATENYVGLCQHWHSTNADGCCVPKEVTPPPPPPPGFCPAGGCTGVQCTTLRGSCSGTACTNGSFGSCTLGGQCCKPAGGLNGQSATITFDNPLQFSTVEGVLGKLLSTLQSIIVVISLVFIVIGAVLYILSAGDDGKMKTAKGAITASMIGLAIGIAAPSFLKEVGTILGWTTTVTCDPSLPSADLATCQAAQAALANGKTLSAIALSTLQFLLSVVGILGLIMLVIGGLAYITAGGDEERSKTGKKIVTYAIIGIAIALASLIIVKQIAGLFV